MDFLCIDVDFVGSPKKIISWFSQSIRQKEHNPDNISGYNFGKLILLSMHNVTIHSRNHFNLPPSQTYFENWIVENIIN